jgi:phosphoribosylglycinamide formyltransferase 1
MRHVRVAVLASGGGTNFQALVDRFNKPGESPVRVELLVASRAGIGAVARAAAAGIHAAVLDPRVVGSERMEGELLRELEAHRIDLVVLAGYLRLVPPGVVARFGGRIINIHPALLPAFGGPGMYGQRVHQAVLEAGVRVSGVTVHEVHEEFDSGTILAQWPVPVLPGDTPETLATRVLAVEHRVLPAVVELLAGAIPAAADPDAHFILQPGVIPAEGDIVVLARPPVR